MLALLAGAVKHALKAFGIKTLIIDQKATIGLAVRADGLIGKKLCTSNKTRELKPAKTC
jgi:hypothetical protein